MRLAPENPLVLRLQACVDICASHGAAADAGEAPVHELSLGGAWCPGPELQEVSTLSSPMSVPSKFMKGSLPGSSKTYPMLCRN